MERNMNDFNFKESVVVGFAFGVGFTIAQFVVQGIMYLLVT